MCNCNSRWVNLAKQLISSNNISCEEKEVLEYLLTNNHCGINQNVQMLIMQIQNEIDNL